LTIENGLIAGWKEVLRIHPENQLLPSRASRPRVQHRAGPR
jgi:hypothetical protein